MENARSMKATRRGSRKADRELTSTQSISTDQLTSHSENTVLKSGYLCLACKGIGIGWTSWKKRWFVLTRTSLVFFRSDPNGGSDANLFVGKIDLNSTVSVVVKADKKHLTVQFPDGNDDQQLTLKAEITEDLLEWKTAIENALAQSPSGDAVTENSAEETGSSRGLSGKYQDVLGPIDGSSEQMINIEHEKCLFSDSSNLLALEDEDGSPSFLEKALRFIERYGGKVEGILRQAADSADVEHRIHEFEHGNKEFSPEEDAHVIADCVKHILRVSPPIPASCCVSLLDAYKTSRGSKVKAMNVVISETFSEPTRLLLKRLLKMMRIVSSYKSTNLMSISATAACMAPLLLRPLMAGDFEKGDEFNVGEDNSLQLMQAAAAANHAQAIVINLMENFKKIFHEGSYSTGSYSDGSGSEEDRSTEEDDYDEEDDDSDGTEDEYDTESDLDLKAGDTENDGNDLQDDDNEESYSSGSSSETNGSDCSKESGDLDSDSGSHEVKKRSKQKERQTAKGLVPPKSASGNRAHELPKDGPTSANMSLAIKNPTDKSIDPVSKRPTWGRTPGRKNVSIECIEFPTEEEIAIQKIASTKLNLQSEVQVQEKENAVLQENFDKRKQDLLGRRLALEKDVARLEGKLQKEKDRKSTLEAAITLPLGELSSSSNLDPKMKAEIMELALVETDAMHLTQKTVDLQLKLHRQRHDNLISTCQSCKEFHQQRM